MEDGRRGEEREEGEKRDGGEGRPGGREEMGGRKKGIILASYTVEDVWKLLRIQTKKLHACFVSFHFMLSHFFIKMALFMMELLWMPFIPTP